MRNVIVLDMASAKVEPTLTGTIQLHDATANFRSHNCWYVYPYWAPGADKSARGGLLANRVFHIASYAVSSAGLDLTLGNSFIPAFTPKIDPAVGFAFGKGFFFLPLFDFGFFEVNDGVLMSFDVKDALHRSKRIKTVAA